MTPTERVALVLNENDTLQGERVALVLNENDTLAVTLGAEGSTIKTANLVPRPAWVCGRT